MEGSIKELVSHRISRAEEDLATSKLLLDDGSYRISFVITLIKVKNDDLPYEIPDYVEEGDGDDV